MNPALISLRPHAFVCLLLFRRITSCHKLSGLKRHHLLSHGLWGSSRLLPWFPTQHLTRPKSRPWPPGFPSGGSGRNLPPGPLRLLVSQNPVPCGRRSDIPMSLPVVSRGRFLPFWAACIPSPGVPSTLECSEGTSNHAHFPSRAQLMESGPPGKPLYCRVNSLTSNHICKTPSQPYPHSALME